MSAPTKLSAIPFGLLDLFASKQGGSYPDEMVGTIQPTIELLELVGLQKVVAGNVAIAAAVAATGFLDSGLLAISGFIHRVLAYEIFAPPNAVNFVKAWPAVQFGTSGVIHILNDTIADFSVAGGVHVRSKMQQQQLWLPPGSRLGALVNQVGGTGIGAGTFNMSVTVQAIAP